MSLSRSRLSRLSIVALKCGSTILSLTVAIVIALLLWQNREALHEATQAPAHLWLLPVAIYLVILAAKGLSFDILANTFDVRVPLVESIGITASGLLGNYLLPGNASLPVRTLYLQRVHGLSYRDFIPIALAAFIFCTGIYGILTGLLALVNGPVGSEIYNYVISAMGFGGALLIVATLFPIRLVKLFGFDPGRYLKGWRQFLHSPFLPWLWLAIELLRAGLEVGFAYTVLRILQVNAPVGQVAIMTLAKECSVILRITPGSFGVAEGVQVFFAAVFGIDVPSVLLSALIMRVIELGWSGLISILLMTRLIGKMGKVGLLVAPMPVRGVPSSPRIQAD
mgnify:CR=1 FL=1